MNETPIAPPAGDEYAPFYEGYVKRVVDLDVLATLRAQLDELARRFGAVPSDREEYRYAADKWSVRQVLGHMIDAERVFGYRAMCIAHRALQIRSGRLCL